MPFIRIVLVFIEKSYTTVSLNQHHSHLMYGSQYPLKWTEPVTILVYRQNKQIPRSIIEGMTQRVCEQVPPTKAEGSMLLIAG